EKLFNKPNETPFVKDAFHEAVIEQKNLAELRKKKRGTKFSPVYNLKIAGGSSKTIYLRLSDTFIDTPFPKDFRNIFIQRKEEADEFYVAVLPKNISSDLKNIQRKALAGLLWSKQ